MIYRKSTHRKPTVPKPLLATLLLFFLAAATVPASATDAPRSFSLSTTRTFAPGESVKIQLMASNVPELEFRVYKVRDAEKFFAGLKDVHSFGVQNYLKVASYQAGLATYVGNSASLRRGIP